MVTGLEEVFFFFFLEFNMTVTLAETIRTLEENTCNAGHSYLCFFSL